MEDAAGRQERVAAFQAQASRLLSADERGGLMRLLADFKQNKSVPALLKGLLVS